MTEKEWLRCSKPEVMLQFLARKRTKGLLRKLRLFGCAACRRVPLSARTLKIVRAAEELSEQDAQSNDVLVAFNEWTSVLDNEKRSGHALHNLGLVLLRDRVCDAAFAEALLVREVAVAITGKRPRSDGYIGWTPVVTARWDERGTGLRKELAELLRHVIGNPFRPVVLRRALVTRTVLALAEAIGAEAAFDRLPILADALEEAGCGDREVLDHCRQSGEHVRGCWVVDLILGRQ